MIAYHIGPIDWNWRLLPTVQEVGLRLPSINSQIDDDQHSENFWHLFSIAQELARKIGWEGDYRSDARPRVFWLPDPDSSRFSCGFVWKQDNNGSTFVISPYPMSWLGEHCLKRLDY